MKILADEQQIQEVLDRLAGEIRAAMARSQGPWAFIGILTHGDTVAKRLAEKIKPDYLGQLDITLYRDDLSELGPHAIVRGTNINFNIDKTNVLLIDDVIMTGRSVRAALGSLIDLGRPRCVRLLTLVDRGGRELPIAPDFVGIRALLERTDLIQVSLKPDDEQEYIAVSNQPEHPND